MVIEFVEYPPQPLINSEDKVMQIVVVSGIISIELFFELKHKHLIVEKVVHRICDLFNIGVDV